MLVVEHLGKRFDIRVAVEDGSFTVAAVKSGLITREALWPQRRRSGNPGRQ